MLLTLLTMRWRETKFAKFAVLTQITAAAEDVQMTRFNRWQAPASWFPIALFGTERWAHGNGQRLAQLASLNHHRAQLYSAPEHATKNSRPKV